MPAVPTVVVAPTYEPAAVTVRVDIWVNAVATSRKPRCEQKEQRQARAPHWSISGPAGESATNTSPTIAATPALMNKPLAVSASRWPLSAVARVRPRSTPLVPRCAPALWSIADAACPNPRPTAKQAVERPPASHACAFRSIVITDSEAS